MSCDLHTWTLAAGDDLQVLQCHVEQRIFGLWVFMEWITRFECAICISRLVDTDVSQTY